MFLANVGDGFLHIILNEPNPIDWMDSGHCSKLGVRNSYAESFRLLETKDGQNKLDYPPLPRVLTITGVKSTEFPYIQNYHCG